MSFYYANARQPEIIRTQQKDAIFSDAIGNNLSDILRIIDSRFWIKYNGFCKIIGDLTYHLYLTINNLQTLGEEYTGIIQIDSEYISIPSKCLQCLSILLEFTGEPALHQVILMTEQKIQQNTELLPNVKANLIRLCKITRFFGIPYVKALHRSLFFIYGGKLSISKRLMGINYVLIRYWLNVNYSIYGYKILGGITMLQLILSLLVTVKSYYPSGQRTAVSNKMKTTAAAAAASNQSLSPSDDIITMSNPSNVKCVLCLETRQFTSLTQCGHAFCWYCILDWLNQKEECPICRESIKKSTTICLQNF